MPLEQALEQLRPEKRNLGEEQLKIVKKLKRRSEHIQEVTSRSNSTISEDFIQWSIDERIAKCLIDKFEITHLFSLQREAIKQIIGKHEQDVCVSAPTGSGKTLIYSISIVHFLSKRIVPRIRGLIVLPSRDLAKQVFSVLNTLCNAVGLVSVLLAGEVSLVQEGNQLVTTSGKKHSSLADIIVATPGRLLDHIEKTKGFSLEHLEYLIIDEADRLLTQSYQDWLDRVYVAAHKSSNPNDEAVMVFDKQISIPDQRTYRSLPTSKLSVLDLEETNAKRMRRILCSATLTSNPQKLAALSLFRPLIIDSTSLGAGEEETEQKLPSTLKEIIYRVSSENKPLILLHILQEILRTETLARVLVFTSSVSRAGRLHSLLLETLPEAECQVITSESSKADRSKALSDFKESKCRVLIGSDLAARGIDVEGLEYVLSYDVPAHLTTYVHRAGRTARAGKGGTSIVLLRGDQARHFNDIKVKLNSSKVKFTTIERSSFEIYQEPFKIWHKKNKEEN